MLVSIVYSVNGGEPTASSFIKEDFPLECSTPEGILNMFFEDGYSWGDFTVADKVVILGATMGNVGVSMVGIEKGGK